MDDQDKVRLRLNRSDLVSHIQTEFIVDHLITHGVLKEDDDERIKAEVTTRDRAAALLNMLPRRGANAYKVFCEALSQDPALQWLVGKLEHTDVSEGCSILEPQFTEVSAEVCKILTKDAGVLKNWKFVARQLGVEEVDIVEIDECHRGLRERTWQMLTVWRDREGSEASVLTLARALRDCGHNAVAEKLVRTF